MDWSEVAIADYAYFAVNDVCRCKNKPVGNEIGEKYMAKRKLGFENPWHMADPAPLCRGT